MTRTANLIVKVDETPLGPQGGADIEKIRSLVFTPDTQRYYGIGAFVGKAFSVGEGF